MVKFILNKTFDFLKTKPTKLWGISLLYLLLYTLACTLGVIPVLFLPICCLLQAAMTAIYLTFYKTNTQPVSDDLFTYFKGDFKSAMRIVGGILWMELWIFLWALIPVVGVVFAAIKAYSYKFTPYILVEDKEISATEALKKSMAMTEGYKGKMFLCDIAINLAFSAAMFILGSFARIPYVGKLFLIVLFCLYIAYILFISMINGIKDAAFYAEVSTMTPEKYSAIVSPLPNVQQQQQTYYNAQVTKYCPNCGEILPENAKFCNKCGTPLN